MVHNTMSDETKTGCPKCGAAHSCTQTVDSGYELIVYVCGSIRSFNSVLLKEAYFEDGAPCLRRRLSQARALLDAQGPFIKERDAANARAEKLRDALEHMVQMVEHIPADEASESLILWSRKLLKESRP